MLLVRRARNPGRGRWSVPGGKVEPGETDTEALIREIHEETGLLVRVGEFVGRVDRAAPEGGVFHINDYLCHVSGGILTAGDDAAEAAWIDQETFADMERDGELVDELAPTLRGWGVYPAE